jgi:hypothetical protein
MPNYWLGIMAVAFAAALTLWIALVFRADKPRPGPPQDSTPHREVIGGAFTAREGGRQVMPDPGATLVPEPGTDVPRQERPSTVEQAYQQEADRAVPEQRPAAEPKPAPARQGPSSHPAG